MNNCSFKWKDNNEETLMKNLSMDLKKNDFLPVIGQVGQGKTTLLCSILGETIASRSSEKGQEEGLIVRGKVAYVEQEPFILS